MAREPLTYESRNFVRGKSSQFPFAPGGMDQDAINASSGAAASEAFEDIVKGVEKTHALGRGGIKTIPPNFERGLDFDATGSEDELLEGHEQVRIEPIYRPATDAPRSSRRVSIVKQ